MEGHLNLHRAIAAGVLLIALALPVAARADDYGPRHDIAAIRHDLPILLAAGPYAVAQRPQFESAVVSGANALVECDTCSLTALLRMHYRYGRWWLLGYVAPSPSGLSTAGVPQLLVALAHEHIALTQKTDAATPPPRCKTFNCYFTGGEIYDVTTPIRLPFNPPQPGTIHGDAYFATVMLSNNDGDASSRITNILGRAPTEAEGWANPPSGNSYFYFSGTVEAAKPVHLQAGTMIEVWFPFVLDTSLRYSLTIAAPNVMSIGPVEGTLKDNTLHFVLPAFTATPDADLMGEIESD